MSDIIIIGAGHGGLIAGAKLALAKHNVVVLERESMENIGYDFTDVFDATCLKDVGIDFDVSLLEDKANMTVISPSKRIEMTLVIPVQYSEQRMERKDLCKVLIGYAKHCGVVFQYETLATDLIIENDQVIGVQTSDESQFFADLVIDCAGAEFSGRKTLINLNSIKMDISKGDFLYAFRATFNRECQSIQPYKVYFLPNEIRGLSWVVDLDREIDVLIGSIDKLNEKDIDDVLARMRQDNPCLGKTMLRCGKVYTIPVTEPLAKLYCGNYVLLGDSARMTIPLIGSGITNSILAGEILAESILKFGITQEGLWNYQSEYFRKHGWEDASLNVIKTLILSLDTQSVDFLFDKKIIKPNDLLMCCSGKELKLKPLDMLSRGVRGIEKTRLMFRFAKAYHNSRKKARIAKKIPINFNEKKIQQWQKKYIGI